MHDASIQYLHLMSVGDYGYVAVQNPPRRLYGAERAVQTAHLGGRVWLEESGGRVSFPAAIRFRLGRKFWDLAAEIGGAGQVHRLCMTREAET